jgi:hypothetical protein
VTNIRPSGKKAIDQGFSKPVNKVATRKACFSELITEDRSCVQAGKQANRLKSKMERSRKSWTFIKNLRSGIHMMILGPRLVNFFGGVNGWLAEDGAAHQVVRSVGRSG